MHTQHNSPLHNPKFRLENFKNSLSFCKVVLRIIIQYDVLAKQNSCDIVTINLPVLFQLIQRHPYVKSETGSLVLQAILKLAIYCSISLKSWSFAYISWVLDLRCVCSTRCLQITLFKSRNLCMSDKHCTNLATFPAILKDVKNC